MRTTRNPSRLRNLVMFSPVPNERLLGGTRDLLFPVPRERPLSTSYAATPGRFCDSSQESRAFADVDLDHSSLRQWTGSSCGPADVPHVGADTPIGQAQWSTRNTTTAFIFQ